MPESCQVTLEAPRGALAVSVPLDVPVEELLADFVEAGVAADQADDATQWVLASASGQTLPAMATLSDCGVDETSVLVLRPAHGEPRRVVAPADSAPSAGDQPLSVRSRLILPAR